MSLGARSGEQRRQCRVSRCITWSEYKVRELIAVKLLHTLQLNTTVAAFKVLPLESYAPMFNAKFNKKFNVRSLL